MPGVPSARGRLAICGASLVVSAGLLTAYLRSSPGRGTAELVQRDLEELLEERSPPEDPKREREPWTLVREPLSEAGARKLFGQLEIETYAYDPHVYFKRNPGLEIRFPFREHPEGEVVVRTNSLGMREDVDVLDQKPDLRILVAGDSQTEGVCNNDESAPNLMERLLARSRSGESIEVLNAALGGYSPYSYLGTIERFGYLDPDLFVVFVYGGNDFFNALALGRYFDRRGGIRSGPMDMAGLAEELGELQPLMPTELSQVCYFLNNPGDVDRASETMEAIALEIVRVCEEVGATPLFVHVPGPLTGQGALYERAIQTVLDTAGIDEAELQLNDRLADRFLAFLEGRGHATADLRRAFGESTVRYYWEKDMHLNLAGNRCVGLVVANKVEEMLRGREE